MAVYHDFLKLPRCEDRVSSTSVPSVAGLRVLAASRRWAQAWTIGTVNQVGGARLAVALGTVA